MDRLTALHGDLRKECTRLSETVSRLESEANSLSKKNATLAEDLSDAKGKASASDHELAGVLAGKIRVDLELAQARQVSDGRRNQVTKLEDALRDAEMELLGEQERVDALNGELKSLRDQITHTTTLLEQAKVAKQEAERAASRSNEASERAAKQVEQLNEVIEGAEEEIGRHFAENEAMDLEKKRIRIALDTARHDIAVVQEHAKVTDAKLVSDLQYPSMLLLGCVL